MDQSLRDAGERAPPAQPGVTRLPVRRQSTARPERRSTRLFDKGGGVARLLPCASSSQRRDRSRRRLGRHAIVRRGVELVRALPEARPPINARTTEPAHFGDPTGTVSCEVGVGVPLAFLATATEAVHHRCITSTAFGGLPRDRGSTRNRMVKPNPPAGRLVGRRIRLTGLLRKITALQGFSIRRSLRRTSWACGEAQPATDFVSRSHTVGILCVPPVRAVRSVDSKERL